MFCAHSGGIRQIDSRAGPSMSRIPAGLSSKLTNERTRVVAATATTATAAARMGRTTPQVAAESATPAMT